MEISSLKNTAIIFLVIFPVQVNGILFLDFFHPIIRITVLTDYFVLLLVAGNWSKWENHTDCTELCGNGTQLLIRSCNNPVPGPYGKQCIKEDGTFGLTEIKNVSCNVHSCPGR